MKADQVEIMALANQLAIRREMRDRLLTCYGGTFGDVHRALKEMDGLEFVLLNHAVAEVAPDFAPALTVHIHKTPALNAQLLISEVIDDFWAAFHCFSHGFTKQSQSILRNTVELIVQLFWLRLKSSADQEFADEWTSQKRGIMFIERKLNEIVEKSGLLEQGDVSRLKRLYNILCMSTHSHKYRMTSLNVPKSMPILSAAFEPHEMLYTKALFLSVVSAELGLLIEYMRRSAETDSRDEVVAMLAKSKSAIDEYRETIASFEKGYIVHREHVEIDGIQVLYSIKLDGEYELPGKKMKWSESRRSQFEKQVRIRLVRDTK